ncbi:uncharacterized protein SAMN05216184_10110 [Georgenia satyanarayanai]|uniref:Metal-binding protein n=1 Tax=Georgenia satyanarayanai TaxID=860221 RepID=A0A2Y9BUV8_9MICO|nr:DUF177 domain-containing protein [Georgenia satyanarayanai]PYG01552.1 uncharacterized protein A8987_10110 [Georgenia satyanarayanai]SSA36352.1 uncharacterized protein SAMN05216184_10110 [Georgenia satyanarayanai]
MDPRSPFVISTHDLARQPGTLRTVERAVPAPKDFGTAVMWVVPGSDIRLDLRLEAVMEGVLVSGDAGVELQGECSRCLREITESRAVDVNELFFYPGARKAALADGDEEAEDMLELEGELLDLEPVVRDAVVTAMPFRPLCEEGCRGLCAGCGERLDDLPADHEHVDVDPRWAALAGLAAGGDDDAADGTDGEDR